MPIPVHINRPHEIVPEPCIKVCQFHEDVCIGCYRVRREKTTWFSMTIDEKKQTVELCKLRRLQTELNTMLAGKKKDAENAA